MASRPDLLVTDGVARLSSPATRRPPQANLDHCIDWGRELASRATAPEVLCGEPQESPRTDQYLLGSVLYRLLAGRGPFDETDQAARLLKMLQERPVPLSEAAGTAIEPDCNWLNPIEAQACAVCGHRLRLGRKMRPSRQQ